MLLIDLLNWEFNNTRHTLIMSDSLIAVLFAHPRLIAAHLFAEALPACALAYGVVWLFMRPTGAKLPNPVRWHLIGLVVTLTGSAVIRLVAIATIAGHHAFNPPAEGGGAAFYLLILPAVISYFYFRWLKSEFPSHVDNPQPEEIKYGTHERTDESSSRRIYSNTQRADASDYQAKGWGRALLEANGDFKKAKQLYDKRAGRPS